MVRSSTYLFWSFTSIPFNVYFTGDFVTPLAQGQKTEDFSLLNYIGQLWQCHDISSGQIETLLQSGKLLILLDGLDEVPQQHNDKIVQQIQQFSQLYYQNKIIVTCRLAAQQFLFRSFTYVELADFNPTQIETFAHKWFTATAFNPEEGKAKAEQFLEQLQRRENRPIRELVVTPILLSLICSVFQERCSFPTKRAKLYQEGLEILLVRWDRVRGIQRDRAYRQLSFADKITLLNFLQQKATSLQLPYDLAAVRAFYFGLFQNRDLSLATSLDVNLASELDNELALDLALARAKGSAVALTKNPELKQILNFNFALELEKSFSLTSEMEQALQAIKEQLPDLAIGKEKLITWWQTNGRDWINEFRNLINEHRYNGRDWYFNRKQQQLL
jgi:predicted NACHT family NTPase